MDTKKYAKKDLYISIILVAISFLMLLGATIAWFAMNKQVEGSNMEMNIQVTPNLVMGNTADSITSDNILLTEQVVFDNDAYLLKPARHSNSGYNADGTGTGLIYNTNPSSVNAFSGYKETNAAALEYQPVPVYGPSTIGRRFYIDYEAFISSKDKEMEVSAFNASVSCHSEANKDYFQAASVDFYLDGTTSGAFKGTLNIAGKQYDDPSTVKTILDITGPTTVPNVDSGEYLHVLMRFYFDGALEDEPGQAYVYSAGLSVADFHLTVEFDAVEVAQ